MFMQHVPRFVILPFFAASMTGVAWAKEEGGGAPGSKASEYKRSDANFYLKSDILKATPGAVIIPLSGYTQKDDSYFFTPKIKAPKTLQFEVVNDWIESITPPDAAAGLSMPPDAIQIREPQGDVRVAMPSSPGNFVQVTDGMSLVNGAVIKTGPTATAAILFGGVFSARLMPNSAAAVQQTVTPVSRTVEVDLTTGGVFSKVGQQVGVKSQYEVHTPFGNAVARGTDFVTIVASGRTDVWVAQGTVSLDPIGGKAGQMATADGSGPLKVMRLPAVNDVHQILADDAETLTAILNFIPMANQKVAALRAKLNRGDALTPGQQEYLGRIKQVPSLIKLALVEKPKPEPKLEPKPEPKPIAVTPLPTPLPPVAPKPREPAAEGGAAPPPPMTITLGPGDKVNFENQDTTVTKLKARLAEIAKANPATPLEIARDTSVGPILLKRVVDAGKHAKLTTKVLDATPAVEAPPPVTPAPAKLTAESVPVTPAVPEAPKTPALKEPLSNIPEINIAKGDTIQLKDSTSMATDEELKARLAELAKTNTGEMILVSKDPGISKKLLQKVVDACHAAKLKVKLVTNKTATPAPTASVEPTPVPPMPKPTAESVPEATPKVLPVTTTEKPKSEKSKTEKSKGPLTVQVNPNGSIKFLGKTLTLAEFQTKLAVTITKTPEQELIIKSGTNVPYDHLKDVLDSCANAHVRSLTVASPSPAPPPFTPASTSTSGASSSVPYSSAPNLPAPALLMHPSMSTMSSNAPPMAPSAPSSSNSTPTPAGP